MIIIKTLIELFDECQIENVIAALCYNPDKIVFIGYKDIMTNHKRKSIESFFKMKNLSPDTYYETVNRYDYQSIKNKLSDIVMENPDCCIDLTGGTELILTAAGSLAENNNIPVFQFDLIHNKLIMVANCQELPPINIPDFSINEYIVLNGGSIIKKSSSLKELSMDSDFLDDIEKAWNIRRKSAELWRDMISALRILENKGYYESELSFTIMNNDEINSLINTITPFINVGFIIIKKHKGNISISHKNRLIHEMLLKVGSIFEFYTYAAAKEIAERSKGYYSDIDMSVFVDWDGIINSSGFYHDTINEVDVILVRGSRPVFISCKSGELKKESLYELQTVAHKFGGRYAKMIIVATHVSYNDAAKDTILQRAKDMGIEVIYNTDVIPKERFLNLLMEKSK